MEINVKSELGSLIVYKLMNPFIFPALNPRRINRGSSTFPRSPFPFPIHHYQIIPVSHFCPCCLEQTAIAVISIFPCSLPAALPNLSRNNQYQMAVQFQSPNPRLANLFYP